MPNADDQTISALQAGDLFARTREHGVAHFHLIANDGRRAAYAIETHVLLAGGVDPRDRREALAWAKVHTAQLMQKWQEFNA